MKRLCTICARAGSKGVKHKNIRQLLGRPLIIHTLEHARESGLFDKIAVSSDSEAILSLSLSWGVDYAIRRPVELASDEAPKLPAIRHCVSEVESMGGDKFDTFVDLDATSPLRIRDDIINAVELLETTGVGNIITAMPARRSPYFNLLEIEKDGIVRLSKPPNDVIARRQDSPVCYDMNGSIYVWNRECLFERETLFNMDTKLYLMPEERSIDIDTELDFLFVEFLMTNRC